MRSIGRDGVDARDNLKHNPFPTANTPEGGTSEGRSPARYTIRNSGTPKGGGQKCPVCRKYVRQGKGSRVNEKKVKKFSTRDLALQGRGNISH